jgi:hypothetical protein
MVKQKKLEIMAKIESTTNLIDNNIKEEKVDNFFELQKSSDNLNQDEDDEKIIKNESNNQIIGSKLLKKDELHNSLTNSPIIFVSDVDTDNEEKIPQMRKKSSTNNNNDPVQATSPRPVSVPKNKVCFNEHIRLSPTFVTNGNHHSYNDTVNSTSSIGKGQVLFLNKLEPTSNPTTSSLATSPIKTNNTILNQTIPVTNKTLENVNNNDTKIDRQISPNTIKNIENSDEENNPPDDSSKCFDLLLRLSSIK